MNSFIKKFNYFGANLGLSEYIDSYIDLESFFLELTLHFNDDSRTQQAVLNWCYIFGDLLSPSKIRRVMKKNVYDQKNILLLIKFIHEHGVVLKNWSILGAYDKALSLSFVPQTKKYLKKISFIEKNCPELRYRIQGNSQVSADIKAYLEKNTFKSMYDIAKNIDSAKNRVNEEYRKLVRLEII